MGPAPIDLFGFDPTFGRLAVLDDLMCVGNEANLFDCPHPGATIENCQSPFADANVICGISGMQCAVVVVVVGVDDGGMVVLMQYSLLLLLLLLICNTQLLCC